MQNKFSIFRSNKVQDVSSQGTAESRKQITSSKASVVKNTLYKKLEKRFAKITKRMGMDGFDRVMVITQTLYREQTLLYEQKGSLFNYIFQILQLKRIYGEFFLHLTFFNNSLLNLYLIIIYFDYCIFI